MTTYEHLMLSICCGVALGFYIGMMYLAIRMEIENRREKKRKKALEKEVKDKE